MRLKRQIDPFCEVQAPTTAAPTTCTTSLAAINSPFSLISAHLDIIPCDAGSPRQLHQQPAHIPGRPGLEAD